MKSSKGIVCATCAITALSFLAAGSAWADWVPTTNNRFFAATISVNNSSATVTEQSYVYGPLYRVAGAATGVPLKISAGLNEALRPKLQSYGATLLSGVVSGDLQLMLTPQSTGIVGLELTGMDYQAVSQFSGSLAGVVRYDCQNMLTLTSTRIVGQIGGTSGPVTAGSVGMTTIPSSSTWCDTNLSWLLPVVGDIITNRITGTVDAQVESGIANAVNGLSGELFIQAPGNNFRSGLQNMVPQSTVIRLSNGQDFRIGDYVWNNFNYIVANSQIRLKLGQYAPVTAVRGMQLPYGNVLVGVPLRLEVTLPDLRFSVELRDEAWVDWRWVCNVTKPNEFCEEP